MPLTEMTTPGQGGSGGGGVFVKLDGTDYPTPTTSDFTEITLDFEPTMVLFYTKYTTGNTAMVLRYDVTANKLYQSYNGYLDYDNTATFIPSYVKVEGKKVYYKAYASAYANYTYMMAIQ